MSDLDGVHLLFCIAVDSLVGGRDSFNKALMLTLDDAMQAV